MIIFQPYLTYFWVSTSLHILFYVMRLWIRQLLLLLFGYCRYYGVSVHCLWIPCIRYLVFHNRYVEYLDWMHWSILYVYLLNFDQMPNLDIQQNHNGNLECISLCFTWKPMNIYHSKNLILWHNICLQLYWFLIRYLGHILVMRSIVSGYHLIYCPWLLWLELLTF